MNNNSDGTIIVVMNNNNRNYREVFFLILGPKSVLLGICSSCNLLALCSHSFLLRSRCTVESMPNLSPPDLHSIEGVDQ